MNILRTLIWLNGICKMQCWPFITLLYSKCSKNLIVKFLQIHKVAQSCLTLCDPTNCSPPGSSVHGTSPSKNTGVGSPSLLRGSSQPKDRTQVSCIAGGFFTIWATREAQYGNSPYFLTPEFFKYIHTQLSPLIF